MALQTLEGDLIPMRPAKETLTRYAVLLLGAAILSFGLFNVHSQSGVTEGGVLGTTLLLHHWFGISPGVSEFVIDVICYALGFRFLGKAFFKYAIAASAGFACFYMLWERVGPVLPDLSGQPLIAALLGGVFVGVGVGLVVRAGGASGGDDVLALEGAPPGTQPEQQVLDALGEEELTAMILDLREPYRTPCRLVLLEQHTMAEAAQLCGRPPKTVEAQIYRAKKMLAQQILQRENDGKECVHGTV